jgi:hypothetical protein
LTIDAIKVGLIRKALDKIAWLKDEERCFYQTTNAKAFNDMEWLVATGTYH